MLTHYELTRGGHYYPSPVDEPEHLNPGYVDRNNRCVHQDDASTCPYKCGTAESEL